MSRLIALILVFSGVTAAQAATREPKPQPVYDEHCRIICILENVRLSSCNRICVR